MSRHDVIRLPFGDGTVDLNLPSTWRVEVTHLPSQECSSLDLHAIVRNPITGPSLCDLVWGASSALIVFTDATRPTPDHLLIPPILEELHRGGLKVEDVKLLCGVGMHRASTPEEKISRLGNDIVEQYAVLDHNPAEAIQIGEEAGVPLWVNRQCLKTDLLITTGLVEPHQLAGYSGGGKTVAIGCGGSETIRITHGPRFLDHPSVRLGNVEGNLFQTIIRESARLAGLRFVVNVVLGGDEQIIYAAAGPPLEVHEALTQRTAALYEAPVSHAPYDVIIVGVGSPKDVNLYQASRAATYVDQPSLLRDGGVVIVPAPCPEGAGRGQGEQNASESLSGASSVPELLDRLRREGCRPGEQRAFMLARLLARARVIVVGAQNPALAHSWHMLGADTLEQAVQMAESIVGCEPNVLVVPHALQMLPRPVC